MRERERELRRGWSLDGIEVELLLHRLIQLLWWFLCLCFLLSSSIFTMSSVDSSTSSLALTLALPSPEHEKHTLSIRDMDLSPAEEVSMHLTASEYEEEPIDDWRDSLEYTNFLLIDVAHDGYFPRIFKKYMKGQLKWSRPEISGEPRGNNELGIRRIDKSEGIRWVFWSRQDDDPPSFDGKIRYVSASLKVRDNIRHDIRHTLKEMILNKFLDNSLVQFWAPIKTLEGRTMLRTQYQPFALGKTHNKFDRQRLCEYRMKMCREYNFFYADAESGEEQLGLLGRVFFHQFPESSTDVTDYSLREYPQLLDALESLIKGSWALPVFERSSQTCVGVLEIVSLRNMPSVWHEKSFLGHLWDIFQEFGLQIFDGYKPREMQFRYKNNALTAMLLDSSDQQSINCSNNGQNVGTIEQNIILASSAEEGTRKKQKMEHKTTGPRIDVSFEDILKCSKMSPNHAARKLKVSISRFKRVCRGFGIYGWPPPKIDMVCYSQPLPFDDQDQIPKLPSHQTSSSVGNYIKPGLQDVANMVTIKAKSPNYNLKFRLPLLSRLEDLKQEVAKRLNLETYYVMYKDEEGELILIACDEDLQDCIHTYRSMGKSTIVVLLEPE